MHVSRSTHVGDQHQEEVRVAVDGEMHSSGLRTCHSEEEIKTTRSENRNHHSSKLSRPSSELTCNTKGKKELSKWFFGHPPAVLDSYNAGLVDSDLLERGLSHVEMLKRQVTPAAVVIGKREVGRAEVGSCDGCDGREAPPRFVTFDLEASSAAEAVSKERAAESNGIGAVSLAVEVSVSASASFCARRIAPSIERRVCITPERLPNVTTRGTTATSSASRCYRRR